MEGLLIALLIGLVTSFLNKKDDKKAKETKPFMPQKQMPQQTTNTHRRKEKVSRPTVKSLEDFTRDVMTQLQTKVQPKTQEVVEAVQEVAVQKVEKATRQPLEERVKQRQQTARVVESTTSAFEFPTSRQQLQQAIVMTEVLGKPKAKQR